MTYPGDPRQEKDYRPGAITRIGCIGVSMLAISAGMAAYTVTAVGVYALILPLLIILAIVIGILVVWYVPADKRYAHRLEVLQDQLLHLNDRLTNLETIDAFERKMAQRDAQAVAGQQAQEGVPDVQPGMRPKQTENQ
ncbi:MAG: hypothetical protein ACYC6A_13735 [Armatimonadota bacterium]